MPSGEVFKATAISSFIATVLMALLANLQFALSAGMGINAFFTYSVVLGFGASWEFALTAVFVEGIIFIILSLTNVRETIFNSIPMSIKNGVSVGIGLFILVIALINANILQLSNSTIVSLIPFGNSLDKQFTVLDM